ncbi:MAG: PAS domain-containing protein [Lentisphaerae bacterium]|nr:PAS domain-containing protein [Lentisphaerota bacterium]
MKSGFVDRLIDRLDRLDPESLQSHFLRIAQDRGLLEMVFQSIQEGVLVVNSEGNLDYANRAAEQFLGFELDSERGRPVSRYLGEMDWGRILRLDTSEWSKLITREIEITYPVHRFLTFYIVPMHQDSAESQGALVMLRDVTHEREQEASAMESERINAVKLLAAGVAHEIGNPLNALNIHLQLLDREIGSMIETAAEQGAGNQQELDYLHELTEVARTEVSRLDVVITQFLRAIRPTQPQLAPARIEVLLEETLTLLKQEVGDRNIEVEIDHQEQLPKIQVDRDQIKQVFFNIIRNAFQAMPDGGQLKIVLFTTDEYIGISFRDTGVGIRPEEFSRIFEPYHTTKSSGNGLGLMIVQRIVQDHGGQIEVMSKPDSGTGFTVLLPLAERKIRLLNARSSRGRTKQEKDD